MNKLTIACLLSLLLMSSTNSTNTTEYNIEDFYQATSTVSGTKIINSSGGLEDVSILYEPQALSEGKYIVNVTRKGANLYKVDNKNIYIQTQYCYEYCYSKEVVLIIENSYSYTKSRIIF
jgi:hypothetical protein